MIDYQRLYHTGIRVPDIRVAMAEMAPLGVTWCSVQERDQHVWLPGVGATTIPLKFTYSAEGPQHLELLEGAPGSIWDGREAPGVHHLGVWVDDVAAETQACVAAGWTVLAAQAPPENGYGAFTYVAPPNGTIVELVWSRILPRFEIWWGGGELG
jgi:catechol 2,3-dioxygenase-like lactoylglutathione lyase family enzyme